MGFVCSLEEKKIVLVWRDRLSLLLSFRVWFSGFEVIVCLKREDPIEIQGRNLDFCCNWHHFGGNVLIWFVDSAVLEPGFDLPVSVVCCILVYSWIEL